VFFIGLVANVYVSFFDTSLFAVTCAHSQEASRVATQETRSIEGEMKQMYKTGR